MKRNNSKSNQWTGDKYYGGMERYGVFTCAEDLEEHERLRSIGMWDCDSEEME